LAAQASDEVLTISFLYFSLYDSIFNDRCSYHQFASGFPGVYVDGVEVGFQPIPEITAELAAGAAVAITGSVSGGGASGTITNTSGASFSSLTVFAFGFEPGETADTINVVKMNMGTASISSLNAGEASPFSISGSPGSYKVVVAVFNSSRKCLNCRVLN